MSDVIKHKHLIIRAETKKTPEEPKWLHSWLVQLVDDIGMDICQGPITAYVDVPGNKGLTGVVIIETSHIAVHIWDEINPGLLQMDVYSCADFNPQDIFDKIEEAFEPVKLEYKFLDREKSLTTIESKNKIEI
jgi:S-adenosylmethionine/arginine decarboxylase-like enzyme